MHTSAQARRAAAAIALMLTASTAFAAAPDSLPVEETAPITGVVPLIDYALETEIVVHNWVLCVSQPFAEQLARAREIGPEDARSAYAELASARSCGQFPELRVILQERLYSSAAASGADARVFGALVNLSGDWASAFIVSDALANE